MKIPRVRSTKPGDRRKIVTPERREALKKMGWKKGQTGNPAGRPPELQEIKEAVQMNSLDAVEVMKDLMHNSTNEAVRQRAAQFFLDPFISKAAQKHEHDVNVTHMAAFLAEVSADLDKDLIDGKIVEALPLRPDGV